MTECSTCRLDFVGLRDFDSHRVGNIAAPWSLDNPEGRRCLDRIEMAEAGWMLDRHGRWGHPRRAVKTPSVDRHSPLRKAA